MRYCSHCGSPLNAGAFFCHNCGTRLTAVVPEAEEVPGAGPAAGPVPPVSRDREIQEEKEFLDTTHRLLRWEQKAWSISGKVILAVGIVFAVLYMMVGLFALVEESVVGTVFLLYSLLFGGMLIAMGIVSLKAADKIPFYTDTLYKDFSHTDKRCNSIGMIVFCYFFNNIALIFFLINFIRMKCNAQLRQRILARQGIK